MTASLVIIERQEEYAIVTLNRPEVMNALSRALCRQLTETISALETDPTVRVLILTGAGRAFCAGLDLKELGASADPAEAIFDRDLLDALDAFSGPIIGAVNGVCLTGGFELALACDVLIASPEARFADTHARVGLLPGWGLSQKLSRILGPSRAKEISLTGNFISAAQAAQWGLVNRVVPAADLMAEALRIARDMLSAVPEFLTAYKQLIDEGYRLSLGRALELERRRFEDAHRKLTAEMIENRREAVRRRGRSQIK